MATIVDSVRDKLLSLDTVRELLSTTEPVASYRFSAGKEVRFRLQPGWNHGIEAVSGESPVKAYIELGRVGSIKEYQLTKDSVLEATSAVGLKKSYVFKTPAVLIEDHINYWFREGWTNREFQLLVTGPHLGSAIRKASVVPFSNLCLLEKALSGIEAKYGEGEVLADYKFTHSLRRTHLRLIVPEYQRVIENTDNDTWSVGLQIRNSLTGEESTSIDGYLFCWESTSGSIDTHFSSGAWSRRGAIGNSDEVYGWARTVVDEILEGLESSLDTVQSLADTPLEGSAASVLRDVFTDYKVPPALRDAITNNMVDADQLTMYSMAQAITQVANSDGLDPKHCNDLMEIGGELSHYATDRCGQCSRLIRS